jgi:hypothetical protein
MRQVDAPPPGPEVARRFGKVLLVIALIAAGALGRSIAADGVESPVLRWLPWLDREPATVFFGAGFGDYLVPVSHQVEGDEASLRSLLDELIAGPPEGSSLVGLVPPGSVVNGFEVDSAVASLDLGGDYRAAPPLAHEAVMQSLATWPGVEEVRVSVDGSPLETNSAGHLLFFYDEPRDMLVAAPTNRVRPADVLQAWLDGPGDDELIGLPGDIQIRRVDLADNQLLSLHMTFRPSLREFAIRRPEAVRRVLEGLIATFSTGFPDVAAVLLDFDGRNALGLGQCANLLNSAQQMPEVLNDERLLVRFTDA